MRRRSMVSTLFIVLLRADKTASGLAFRLMVVWKYINDHYPDKKTFLLTNKTIWNRVFPNLDIRDYPNVYSFDDQKGYKFKALFLWLRAALIIIRHRINTIHSSGNILLYPLLILKPLLRFRNCVTIGSGSIDQASTYKKSAAAQWEMFIRKSDALDILNPTHQLHHFSCQKYVSPCSFPFMLQGRSPDSFDFNYSHRSDYILYIGTLIPAKNPQLCVAAFELFLSSYAGEFRAQDRRPSLIIVGKGPLKAELEQKALQLNTAYGYDAVIMTQNDQQIEDYLKRSKIFLSFQAFGNYPSQSLMEAMLFQQSVIANDLNDTNLLVKTELGNALIQKLEPEPIANAINRLLLPWEQNRQNHNFIMNHHSIERFAQYLVDIHQDL